MNTQLPAIASVSDFQRNYPSPLKKLKSEKSPLFMLKNNKVEAVLLKPSAYQSLMYKIENYELQDAQEKIQAYVTEKRAGTLKKAKQVDELFA